MAQRYTAQGQADFLQILLERHRIGPKIKKAEMLKDLNKKVSFEPTNLGRKSISGGMDKEILGLYRVGAKMNNGNLRKEKFISEHGLASGRKGFTLLEIVVVVAVIGLISITLYPSILNTLEKRRLEGAARDILTTIQRAKFQAVKTRLNHRVRFEYIQQGDMDTWVFYIEREDTPGNWSSMPGFLRGFIPANFNVSVNFPNQIVEFSPLGFVSNYSTTQNSIIVQSLKLNEYDQPDQRVLSVFIGGSVQYAKSQSGE